MGARSGDNAQDIEDRVRGDVLRDARWGITEAIGGLWKVWAAILGDEPSTARAFASLLEAEADDWRSNAAHMERKQGKPEVTPKRTVSAVVELRIAVEDETHVDMVRSDLFRLMKGLAGRHDVPGMAAGWVLKVREPTEGERELVTDLAGWTSIGRED